MVSSTIEVIGKGAEAYIYKEGECAVKAREKKDYRHPALDLALRKKRAKKEMTALRKCYEAGIPCPRPISLSESTIIMEYVGGVRLSEIFETESQTSKKKYAQECGRLLARMHSIGICHGDYALTNLIYSNGVVRPIDFGLCEFSTYHEKKAADLAVMYSSLGDREVFNAFIESYKKEYADSAQVIARFEKNLTRGRYKKR
ncbi:MAG: KEOPS complex kinase/ATPase Bud32 [Candidatus Micrarchaeia archaeon]